MFSKRVQAQVGNKIYIDQIYLEIRSVVRFEVSSAVTTKNTDHWTVMPCDSYIHRRFGGTYRLHDKNWRARNNVSSN
jgi:hypothetical protein